MNKYEKDEIANLPSQYRPIGAWSYFGYTILFSIPVIGFICLIIFSLSKSNINRRSFARSYFCAYLIIAILAAVVFAVAGSIIMQYFNEFMAEYSSSIPF